GVLMELHLGRHSTEGPVVEVAQLGPERPGSCRWRAVGQGQAASDGRRGHGSAPRSGVTSPLKTLDNFPIYSPFGRANGRPAVDRSYDSMIPCASLFVNNPSRSPVSAVDVAFHGLRQMISSGRLAAGQKFPPEADLCEELGVSRGSLREAV